MDEAKRPSQYQLLSEEVESPISPILHAPQAGSLEAVNRPGNETMRLERTAFDVAVLILDGLLILFTCVPFLTYAGLVLRYNGIPTAGHEKLKEGLIQASRIVSISLRCVRSL